MKKIRWGVIGCGGIALRRTIPGLVLAENSELIAVMDAKVEVASSSLVSRSKQKSVVRRFFHPAT